MLTALIEYLTVLLEYIDFNLDDRAQQTFELGLGDDHILI